MESSESRASFAALIMCDLIAAGVDGEFDFETLLEEGEIYVAQVSNLDGADGAFLDDLVVVFRNKDCDLVVLYFAEEGDAGLYYFVNPWDIENEILEAGGMREHNGCEYFASEPAEVLEVLNAILEDLGA